ncbi:FecR family protein [Niabella drilacis]|uniref:FecR family protein n=1 Tax=Niabella drilacis (strain DSM 25811 / CCM 8410 / CCUG 62505 / LMG 26954 / E90) TaxID=1285928 RepID=A0A1G6R2E1_NIADE|nr:FecR family protein [Niabella drilacis]SDC98225.1 FecR family protein [Niabella drilacis]
MTPKIRIEWLLRLHAEGKAAPADTEELYGYYVNREYTGIVEALIDELWDPASFQTLLTDQESEVLYRNISRRLSRPQRWPVGRWMAAASVLLVLALGWWWLQYGSGKKQEAALPVITDLAPPAASNAVLFSDNGNKQVLKSRDTLVTAGTARQPGQFNTVFNPRGSQPIAVVLADGTRLWLNAESSVKYPLEFATAERRVQVSGEAYFEVAHEDGKPFIVESGSTLVKVLGTHFNINTFDDKTKVTLLQGMVQVSNQKDSGLIRPGQSAIITDGLNIAASDTVSAVAWKSHLFNFKETPLKEILQEIGRWYDVEVVYEGAVPEVTLSGTINRNINASKVLEMLHLSSGLEFEIRDRHIIVKKSQ